MRWIGQIVGVFLFALSSERVDAGVKFDERASSVVMNLVE